MRTKKVIFIDGNQTRLACDKKAGGPHGINRLCNETGMSNVTLHAICRNGYGNQSTVKKYIDAGFPIIQSSRPVPSRLVKEHSRIYRKNGEQKTANIFKLGDETIELPPEATPIDLPHKPGKHQPEQISFEDFVGEAKVRQMRDVIIKGLANIISELQKI